MLQKLHQNLEKSANYIKPKITNTQFGISHYAGKVMYEIPGFLDKNKNTLQQNLIDMCVSSKDPVVASLFTEIDDEDSAAATAVSPAATIRKGPQMASTISFQFRVFTSCSKV